jgi:hypothetical protein
VQGPGRAERFANERENAEAEQSDGEESDGRLKRSQLRDRIGFRDKGW